MAKIDPRNMTRADRLAAHAAAIESREKLESARSPVAEADTTPVRRRSRRVGSNHGKTKKTET